MPTTRSHATRPKPRAVPTLDLGEGDTLNIVFDSNKITPAWMRDAEQRDTDNDVLSLPKALADVILDWDFIEDDGSKIPISCDELAMFSYPVQRLLLDQILTAAIPSESEGNASSGDSSSPPPISSPVSPTSPNGQATSPSPALSASPSQT